MRIHALEASGGLVYAEMGRFLAADDPDNPAGTSDPAAAVTDEEGNPVPNPARNTWITETALATALNQAFFGTRRLLRHRGRHRAHAGGYRLRSCFTAGALLTEEPRPAAAPGGEPSVSAAERVLSGVR